jgi:hypothetical protein
MLRVWLLVQQEEGVMPLFRFYVDLNFTREYEVQAPTFEEAYAGLEVAVDSELIVLDPGAVQIFGADVIEEIRDEDL